MTSLAIVLWTLIFAWIAWVKVNQVTVLILLKHLDAWDNQINWLEESFDPLPETDPERFAEITNDACWRPRFHDKMVMLS